MLLFDTYSPPSTRSLGLPPAAPGRIAVLDTQELTVDLPHTDTPIQAYRFRTCLPERSRWLKILQHVEPNLRTVNRYIACGSSAWVQYSPLRKTRRIISDTCRLRICPACRKAVQRSLADRLAWAIGSPAKNAWKFVTLTLRHTHAPLEHQLDFLRKSFRRLRQRKLWKDRVQYGWAMIELTYNDKTSSWHPHLHCIVRCTYIEHSSLVSAWEAITKGSKIVHIRVVKSSAGAASYVAKYIGKPPHESILDNLELAQEYYDALKGSRMLIGFGRKRPHLPDKVTDDYPDDWQYEEPLSLLLQLANTGDDQANDRIRTISQEPPYPYFDPQPPKPP